MSDEKVLAVVEQRQVAFYGQELTAMLVEDVPFSSLYGPFVMICFSWTGQREQI